MSSLAQMLEASGASIEAEDDFDAVNTLMREKGWSDGLPIVPPTESRVAAMLEYCDRPWDQPIAKIPPRWGEATPLLLAANAVMAGCQPRYFPLFMLAIERHRGKRAVQPRRPSAAGTLSVLAVRRHSCPASEGSARTRSGGRWLCPATARPAQR